MSKVNKSKEVFRVVKEAPKTAIQIQKETGFTIPLIRTSLSRLMKKGLVKKEGSEGRQVIYSEGPDMKMLLKVLNNIMTTKMQKKPGVKLTPGEMDFILIIEDVLENA